MSDKLISQRALEDAMYHEAFETDTDMQRWDSGCWIRYKLFENVIEKQPEITEEDLKEYCRKRHLVLLDAAFYHELVDSYMRQSVTSLMKEGELND